MICGVMCDVCEFIDEHKYGSVADAYHGWQQAGGRLIGLGTAMVAFCDGCVMDMLIMRAEQVLVERMRGAQLEHVEHAIERTIDECMTEVMDG